MTTYSAQMSVSITSEAFSELKILKFRKRQHRATVASRPWLTVRKIQHCNAVSFLLLAPRTDAARLLGTLPFQTR